MFSRFTRAIVRPPARNFADGLTTVDLGPPDVELAIAQHAAYCAALSVFFLSRALHRRASVGVRFSPAEILGRR